MPWNPATCTNKATLCFSWKKLFVHSLSDPDQIVMHFSALVNDIIRLMFDFAGRRVPLNLWPWWCLPVPGVEAWWKAEVKQVGFFPGPNKEHKLQNSTHTHTVVISFMWICYLLPVTCHICHQSLFHFFPSLPNCLLFMCWSLVITAHLCSLTTWVLVFNENLAC